MNKDPVTELAVEVSSGLPQAGDGEILDGPAKHTDRPLPLSALLTRPVVVSVANYGIIGLLDVTAGALIPLVWSTSVEFGGLGMSPSSIGLWITGYGLLEGIFLFVAFPPIVRRFGPRLVFIASILSFVPLYILFPVENLVLRHSSHGLNPTAILFIMLQLTATVLSGMGFGEFPRILHCARSLKWLRIDQGRYLCTYLPPCRTGGLSALRMESRR